MNLATLRRVVWAIDAVAVLAAGGAAWFAVDGDTSPRDDKEWTKLFSVHRTEVTDGKDGLPPKEEFSVAAAWPQGEKPVKVTAAENAPPPPPPDPLQGVTLRTLWFSSGGMLDSGASFQKDTFPFTLWVGECIPINPNDPYSATGPWRLDEVRPVGEALRPGSNVFRGEAVFHHIDDGREAVKSMDTSSTTALQPGSPDGGPPGDSPFVPRDAEGRPDRRKAPRLALVKSDAAAGVLEYQVPQEEVDWLDAWGADEAKGVAAVATKDEAGNPNGFQLKNVAKGSRLEAAGLKAEDRVVSVNSEKVNSTEQAIAVGKKQYETGSSTFAVKIVRSGREMTFTFHAPKKKAGKK